MTTPNPAAAHGSHAKLRPLEAMFAPRTVAVIGATERAGSVGHALFKNLQLFDGRLFPVNPKYQSIGGLTAFPRLEAVPEPVDLAVIATPAPTVPGIIRDCANFGVRAAVIISAGFRECGAEGAALEQQCLSEARRGRMRVLGPNCLGLMVPRSRLNASFADGIPKPGRVAFLSQSGALCSAVLNWSFPENVGFSAFVSVGSMLDVGWGDLISYFGDDPHTHSIVCYMESVGDARSFLSAAREVSLSKPIIILKVGHTPAAAQAAASHTGALTGSDAVLDAAFRRVGVLRVENVEQLFDMAEVLAKQPRPQGPRLAIVTNAGGPGALATDALVSRGGQLAKLSEETMVALNQFLPAHWSHGNPIDILGDADPERYAKAVALAAADPQTNGVLAILTPQSMTDPTATARGLVPFADLEDKPMLASWMGGPWVEAGKAVLNHANIPAFSYPDRAAHAFTLMWRYSDNLRALYETPTLAPVSAPPVDRPVDSVAPEPPAPFFIGSHALTATTLIVEARKAGRTLLTEVESKQLLAAYGIPTVETHVAFTEDDAVKHAEKLGFPVAIKLFSETLTHKTDVGGVHLDVRNSTAVREAWQEIQKNVNERVGHRHFLGVTVQPMVKHDGYELILGSSIDRQFGPVLLFGTGGQLVEVFQDRALGLPPLNATLARRLMEQTKIFTALQGVRGRKAVDLRALEQLLVRFSQLVAEQPWIAEIDVNPLLVSDERITAVDARVVLHPSETAEEQLPRLAIRPYPAHYRTHWKLRDGTPVTIRPILPEDEPLMVKFHQTLSDRSVYLRYFTSLKLDQRIAHERLSRICFIDYDCAMVLVAERRDPKGAESEILGIGRLEKLHGTNEAEFALTVSDRWQGRGLGTQLLKLLVQIGRDEKLERLVATLLLDNRTMRHVASKVGFKFQHGPLATEERAVLELSTGGGSADLSPNLTAP
ncbi:MAG TPA: bifunctional acetate--CoA ligase family protein/GNAT family N-acetyltransferase [Verrucomicrobiota bacterium]|nr:acetyl CoA synthetase subunit alpha [Verrucomicrobiales bacterium]HRI11824.1 bifunctional acetate--CoA ligase family protein/GNAT family N-acetyltransferase [Verrucomicrobiota bacterium]